MTTNSGPKFSRAILLNSLAEPFCRRGGDIVEVARRNRIPAAALSDPNHLIEASALYGAMEDMASSLDDPYFGAEVARVRALKGVPTLRDSAAHAENLGDFLIRAVLETGRQFDNVTYSLNITPEAGIFSIRRNLRVRRPTVQVDAIGVAFYVTVIRTGLGQRFDPDRILVSAPTLEGIPPDLLPEHALVRSSKTALSIILPAEWLPAPFDLGWSIHEQGYVQPSPIWGENVPLLFMREVIRSNIADQSFRLSDLAQACGISRRRVQRIFSAHRTSFRTIQDDFRREIAVGLVTRTAMPLRDVSQQTGFSGEATFSRRYRRWTGEPPGAHRRRMLPES